MGFLKKTAAPVDNDDDIRREIRARVAKQAGIYDEEYINTGILGGWTLSAAPDDSVFRCEEQRACEHQHLHEHDQDHDDPVTGPLLRHNRQCDGFGRRARGRHG